jgi:allophanate hydrolase
LLDLCALAVPAGFQDDGLPFGITLVAPAGGDTQLAAFGAAFQAAADVTLGLIDEPAPQAIFQSHAHDSVDLFVCGAHMAGLALNPELRQRGGRFVGEATTTPISAEKKLTDILRSHGTSVQHYL